MKKLSLIVVSLLVTLVSYSQDFSKIVAAYKSEWRNEKWVTVETFYPKDMFVLLAKMRINSFGGRWTRQIHARKYHSYFWVFQKTKPKVNYKFDKIITEQDFVVSQDTSLPDHQPSILLQHPQEIQ
jgi:hypothetical protein